MGDVLLNLKNNSIAKNRFKIERFDN